MKKCQVVLLFKRGVFYNKCHTQELVPKGKKWFSTLIKSHVFLYWEKMSKNILEKEHVQPFFKKISSCVQKHFPSER